MEVGAPHGARMLAEGPAAPDPSAAASVPGCLRTRCRAPFAVGRRCGRRRRSARRTRGRRPRLEARAHGVGRRHLDVERQVLALAQHVELHLLPGLVRARGCGRRAAGFPACGRRCSGSRRLPPAAAPSPAGALTTSRPLSVPKYWPSLRRDRHELERAEAAAAGCIEFLDLHRRDRHALGQRHALAQDTRTIGGSAATVVTVVDSVLPSRR